MSKKHSWSAVKAQSARLNFNLYKERERLPTDKRKSKARIYRRSMCPLNHCMKEVRRIGNHLRQYHNLSNEKAKKYTQRAVPMIPEQPSSSSESDSEEDSSTDSDAQDNRLQWHYTNEIHRPGGDGFNWVGKDGDTDWLGDAFFSKHEKQKTNEESTFEEEESDSSQKEPTAGRAANGVSRNEIGHEEEEESESTEDGEDVDFEDSEERFFMSSKEEDKLLACFVKWMCSPDGGKKPNRTALQHKTVVMSIVRHRDSEVSYNNLYNRGFVNEWMNKMNEEQKSPATIKTYLGSLLHLFNFIYVSEYEKMFDVSEIRKVEGIIKQWRRNLWKDIKIHEHKKNLNDMTRFPTAEKIKLLDESDLTKDALNTLNFYKCHWNSPIVKKNFCLVRDYILTNVVFDNGSRPGAIANMTLHEFESAINQTDGFVIRVLKHKNAHMGPANLSMTHQLYRNASAYVKYLRNKLPGVSKDLESPVFVSWVGGKMDGSMITNQFNSFWQRVHGNSDRLNPTLVRKYTTTTVHQNDPSFRQDAADLLCHSLSTAVKSYFIVDKQKKAASTSKKIHETQRKPFSPALSNTRLLEIFKYDICLGTITISVVREKLKDLNCLPESEKELKRVLDFLRYEIKCNGKDVAQKQNGKGLQEEEMEEVRKDNVEETRHELTAGAEIGRGSEEDNTVVDMEFPQMKAVRKRIFFTVGDNNLIFEHLGRYVNSSCSIIKSEFEDYVNSKMALKPLVEKFGIPSLIAKMRTERKSH